MGELTSNVSWTTVLVGAILAYLSGWIWYSPMLFGKKWADGSNTVLGSVANPPKMAMLTQLVAAILLSWVIGLILVNGSILMIVLILACIASFIVAAGHFVHKAYFSICIDGSYIFIMGAIIVAVNLYL